MSRTRVVDCVKQGGGGGGGGGGGDHQTFPTKVHFMDGDQKGATAAILLPAAKYKANVKRAAL
jgi:hypothetical protein